LSTSCKVSDLIPISSVWPHPATVTLAPEGSWLKLAIHNLQYDQKDNFFPNSVRCILSRQTGRSDVIVECKVDRVTQFDERKVVVVGAEFDVAAASVVGMHNQAKCRGEGGKSLTR
jgi:hypothetical protein